MNEPSFGKSYAGSGPENYQRYFVPAIGAPLAAALVDAAGPRPGERVLDVACGTGVVARLVAERVGSSGAVTGLDCNPGMLAVARSLPASGARIEWREGSAEALPLSDGSFDLVTCQMGLQFFSDRALALR
ncbi:MAG TPA: methyltransferase domain-containing protein, partial [Kofleriaceae bacterium]|nr:methyltransferase domain-containing protein [Kofleriaceae bacterium]